MYAPLHRALPQPLVALTTSALALSAVGVSYAMTTDQAAGGPPLVGATSVLVSLILMATIVLATCYPIHLRHHLKIVMTSVPLYLLAVLLAPPLAATAAGLGVLTGELIV